MAWPSHLGPHTWCLGRGQGQGRGHWLLFHPEPSSFSNTLVHLGHLENRNHPTAMDKFKVLQRSLL